MRKIGLLFLLGLLSGWASATNFTVKAGGGGSFTTIQACATAMAAGDTCTVFAGTYNESVLVSSGTVGNYKTFTINAGDVVNVFSFTIGSHVKINGFHIHHDASPTANPCILVNSGGQTDYFLTSNTMSACGSPMIQEPSTSNTTHGFIQGNTLSYGCSTSASPNVCQAMAINGDFHLIENNDISHVSDGPSVTGKHNVLRNNTLHNITTADCGSNSSNCHIDFMESEPNVVGGAPPTGFFLVENNTVNGMVGTNTHGIGIFQADVCSSQCSNAIIRFNSVAHVGSSGIIDDNSGSTAVPGWSSVKDYNNTFADAGNLNTSVGGALNGFANRSSNGSDVNDIFYFPFTLADFNPYFSDGTSTPFAAGHNLGFCTGSPCQLRPHTYGTGVWTTDAGNIQTDPLFVNYSANNFNLTASSPALHTGTFLTTVASGDSHSGTSLIVNDAAYFQDGSGIPGVNGDCVAVTTKTNTICVTAVNYTTNTLTLASGITRASGDSVWLASDSSGRSVLPAAGPNMGSSVNQTWYIRPDGGTRWSVNATSGQCDGLADVAYSGTGVNQHCAFNDYRWLYDDQTFAGTMHWVINGGDQVLIRGCASGPNNVAPSCRIGSDLQAGSGWCPGVGNAGCFNPPIPAGTSSQHTRIVGANYAACTTNAAKQELFGGWGVGVVMNLGSTQYVDIACINLTRHSQCIFFGSPANPPACNRSFPSEDDYADNGITTNNTTANVTITDVWDHGFLSRGVIGPIGGPVTATRMNIDTNGGAGWDFDDGSSTPMGAGAAWTFKNSIIQWSGCNQQYPFVNTIPVASCYSQSSGGYGDAVGSPAGTGLSADVENSTFIYNTQDGLDFGHVDTGGPYTGIFNFNFFAHNGGSNSPKFDHKFGTLAAPVQVIGNVMIGDGARMAAPITGTPTNFNQYQQDFCRAGDNFPFNFDTASGTLVANNTLVTYCPVNIDNSCNAVSCTSATSKLYNNIFLSYAYYGNPCSPSCPAGFVNVPAQDYGGTGIGPSMFFYQNGGPGVRDYQNNLYYGTRQTCPTGFDNGICTSPLLASQPGTNGAGFVYNQLDVFGTTTPSQSALSLATGSPALAAGISYTGQPTTDIFGNAAPGTLPMGAVFVGGVPGTVSTPTCTPAAGTYATTQTVTCSSTTTGSTTYCTIDGSTPTTSSPVCTSIAVSSTLTLKAIAAASGFTNSSINNQLYTITPIVPTTTVSGKIVISGTVQF